jgi:Na+/proline symporter
MVESGFSALDWGVVLIYLAFLFAIGRYFSIQNGNGTRDYFLGSQKMSFGVVAISVLATTQSAATFLGGPDQGYSGNFTYVSSNIGAFIATAFVVFVLLPRFYALKVTTVYNLLEERISTGAMRAAGGVYLVGRVFASGARLYLAAIAVSMILFADIDVQSIFVSALLMTILGLFIAVTGGIRSVIWSDLAQFVLYISAAIVAFYSLITYMDADYNTMLAALENAPTGLDAVFQNKLTFFDLSLDFSKPFTLLSIVLGITLLLIGNYGLDQDTTQRLLTCKNANESGKALFLSAIIAVPVGFLFVAIGQLLYLFYQRPDLMSHEAATQVSHLFEGERVTVFMFYILNEMPSGLKGLMTVGVISASISTLNSGINSMASVVIHDFYEPLIAVKTNKSESHLVFAGRVATVLVALLLLIMSMLCFYWQQYTDMPLLDFALSVMVFAYSGLLGVFFVVVFTNRGSPLSVYLALATGFMVSILLQSYVVDLLALPTKLGVLAFTWKLCIGTCLAFLVCFSGKSSKRGSHSS